MPLSNTQAIVANDPHRFRVLVCGRRWGKTTLALREICKIAAKPNKEVYYLAPTYRMAKTIAWKRLKNKLLDLRWVSKINETELSITLKNNSVISLKGTENYDSIRGISLSAAVFDEFAYMSPEVWEVIRPALADQQGSALFITTPVGKSNWAYDMFCMQDDHPDSWRSFQYTTLDGGFVDQQEIEAARSEMTEQQFKQEFEASFVVGTHLVAWEFDRKDHIKTLPDYSVNELHIGVDFNTTPLCAAVFIKSGEEAWQIDEIYMHDSHTGELAEEILRRYPTSKITVYPDPSGRSRKTSAGGATDFTILQNAGFTVKAPFKHNLVKDRINSYNARLRSADGKIRLFIMPKCKYTIECLEKYEFKPGTMIPDKDRGWDHMFDAASYCIDYIWPIKRSVDPELLKPERWGHSLKA